MTSSSLRIISIVQERVDAFLKEIFDICQSNEGKPKSLCDALATELAICDVVGAAIQRRRNERTPFAHLATDIVHSIFGMALDLNRVHDPCLPLDQLDEHRHQLFRMRQVSFAWNDFLLSSPQYWQVISTSSPPKVILAGIERSGSAPLCVYHCFKLSPAPVNIPEELQSCTRLQTLRSQSDNEYPLYRRLLRDRRPALQTLQLTEYHWPSVDPIEPLGDLPSIRHLTARYWQPPSDRTWLAGLKELVLSRISVPDTELFRVLSACANLERLTISAGNEEGVQELPGATSPITLPRLQDMHLEFGTPEPAIKFIRGLITPQCLRRTLFIRTAWDLGQYVGEYRQIISLEKRCTQFPRSACIRIEGLPTGPCLTYETESSQVGFGDLPASTVHDVVQEFQDLFGEPLLTVTVDGGLEDVWSFLRLLSDQNIRTIVARFSDSEEVVDKLVKVIGSRSLQIPRGIVANTATNWPFESLRSINIHGADVGLWYFPDLVEKHLHKRAKPLLEEIVLVACNFNETELPHAAERLAAIGITLRAVACI